MSSKRLNKLRKAKRLYVTIGSVLVLLGVLGFAFPFLPLRFSDDIAFLEDVAAQATQEVAPVASASASVLPPTATPRPIDPERRNIKDRLVINKLGINMPLFRSTSANVLTKGGWMFSNTPTPDQSGNTVIFGHRVRYLPPISNTFYKLDQINVGDEFSIAWQGTVYKYKVTTKKVIEPTDLTVMEPSSKPIVTLITCAPLFSTKQRLVVVAERI